MVLQGFAGQAEKGDRAGEEDGGEVLGIGVM